MALMMWITGLVCMALATLGCVYLLCAVWSCVKFARERRPKLAAAPPITVLKPLRGAEPALLSNLATLCNQNYPAAIQLVFGVQDPTDEGVAVAKHLRDLYPHQQMDVIVDQTVHGTNSKVSNLVNMTRAIRHPCIIVADSDISVDPDYLLCVAAMLQQPGVGGVTCLYRGLPLTGFWSGLSALGIDTHFLPSVLVGVRFGLAAPCVGSTIALWKHQLDEIGGFAVFADCLADDYAIGAALRRKGLKVAVAPLLVAHVCPEASLLQLWRHELRWARTIRSIDPVGYVGSVISHPLPFALLAVAAGATTAGAVLAIVALACRLMLLQVTGRTDVAAPFQERASRWGFLIPIRDLVSFAVFLWSFFGRRITWGERTYRVQADGTMIRSKGVKA
ncbi:MAG: bacteriohopanetetrol glucosamine biosynthesis glycosyltransferase HpnI [Hyphomicrobiales bacterium]|nr:bacteriohopanetetrol glucosamine biosynthesis glycosyltransferase HpnI [Hyphomicrobiales bacterium]